MSAGLSTDPALARLADAVLIPPFPGHRAPRWVLAALERGLAGVTLFGPNIESPAQLAALTRQLRSAGPQPLVALDEEGGDVTRIAHLTGSLYPGNAALGVVDDVALTRAVHQALGRDLAALGVTVDLAPAVDVNTAADNPVIGIRSFGSDPGLVARHAAAAVSGLQAAGVAACAKHFPGHGSTSADTHRELVTVDEPLDVLRRRDLPPFLAAIAAGVRGVMPGHLRVPELTGELPATLSHAALTGLLRGELGFTGVIISDALEMRAVSATYGIPEAAVRAVAAGTDLLCLGRDTREEDYLAVRRALGAAVAAGRLPAARLEEAGHHVAQLRAWLSRPPGTMDGAAEVGAAMDGAGGAGAAMDAAGGAGAAMDGADGAGADGAGAAMDAAAGAGAAMDGAAGDRAAGDRAATGGAGPDDGRPAVESAHIGLVAARRAVRASAPPGPLTDPVLVQLDGAENIAVGSVPWGLSAWVPPGGVVRVAAARAAGDPAGVVADVLTQAAGGRALIVVVRDAHRHPAARAVISGLVAARPDTVVVDMGLPLWQPPGGVQVATYGAARANAQAAAELLGLVP